MILPKVFPLDVYFWKNETAKTEPQKETKPPNSMTTTRGLVGRVNFLRLVWSTDCKYYNIAAQMGNLMNTDYKDLPKTVQELLSNRSFDHALYNTTRNTDRNL